MLIDSEIIKTNVQDGYKKSPWMENLDQLTYCVFYAVAVHNLTGK